MADEPVSRSEPELRGDLSQVSGARVVVAVSGGPDSTALLHWLASAGVEAVAAHYDHAMRAGSERDAGHVRRLCAALGVELITGRRETPLARGSLQAAARALRYEFLERARRAAGADLVATGHTADDVVEGVLIHLLRGTALAGMRGLPARRGPYARPLIDVWRADVERYLEALGAGYLRDPANADTARFARARVRHELLPALERDRPGIRLRLRAAARAAAVLHERLEAEAREVPPDRAALARAPAPVRREAYRQLYAGAGGGLPGLDRRGLDAIDQLVRAGRTGSGMDLPGGLRLRLERSAVRVGPRVRAPRGRPALLARSCAGCGEPGAAHLRPGLALTVGYRTPGLRMRPLGGAGSRKLQDILVDAGVPRHLRDELAMVFAGGRLAWVPGIAVDADLCCPAGVVGAHVTLRGVSAG